MTTHQLTTTSDDLFTNPSPRVPVAVCLDTSSSMAGPPIEELRRGVQHFYETIYDDEIARYSAEIALITFGGGVRAEAGFGPVEREFTGELQAQGSTPMGAALSTALDMLESRREAYKDAGVDYYQPWLVVMTDGLPTDDIRPAVERISEMVLGKRLSVFSIGIGRLAAMGKLASLSPGRAPFRLQGLEFVQFFEWLSASVQRVSMSSPGQVVPLDLEGVRAWAEI